MLSVSIAVSAGDAPQVARASVNVNGHSARGVTRPLARPPIQKKEAPIFLVAAGDAAELLSIASGQVQDEKLSGASPLVLLMNPGTIFQNEILFHHCLSFLKGISCRILC